MGVSVTPEKSEYYYKLEFGQKQRLLGQYLGAVIDAVENQDTHYLTVPDHFAATAEFRPCQKPIRPLPCLPCKLLEVNPAIQVSECHSNAICIKCNSYLQFMHAASQKNGSDHAGAG